MSFTNKEGKLIVLNIIDTIQKHKDYLSEIDGAIGDGDHGINMNKGVTIAKSQVDKNETLSEALCTLSCVLMEKTQDTCAALTACSKAAEEGMQATCDMQAKLGRASRLKEKSIGHQDAGATSFCLILQTFCSTIIALEKASRKETGDAAIC